MEGHKQVTEKRSLFALNYTFKDYRGRDHTSLRAWCPACREWHKHGTGTGEPHALGNAGSRSSHGPCEDYYLEVVGNWNTTLCRRIQSGEYPSEPLSEDGGALAQL